MYVFCASCLVKTLKVEIFCANMIKNVTFVAFPPLYCRMLAGKQRPLVEVQVYRLAFYLMVASPRELTAGMKGWANVWADIDC